MESELTEARNDIPQPIGLDIVLNISPYLIEGSGIGVDNICEHR